MISVGVLYGMIPTVVRVKAGKATEEGYSGHYMNNLVLVSSREEARLKD